MIMLSPGVETRELDYSMYVRQISTAVLALVGGATKGEMNKPILCTSPEDFVGKFGLPVRDVYAGYAALRFLSEGNRMYFVRVGDGDEAKASVIIDEDEETPDADITFEAKTEGTFYNDMKVIIKPFDDDTDEVYIILQDEDGIELERILVSLDEEADNFIEEEMDNASDHLTADYDPTTNFTFPTENIEGTLEGGDDGIDGLEYTDYEGTTALEVGGSATGLQIYRNVEEVDFNILAAPDVSYSDVISSELIDICETRGDCMALIDPPMELDVQEVVEWHNGDLEGEDYPNQALSSSYAATYWSWLEYSDPFHGGRIWLPPSGEIAATYARNDRMAYPWFAPAGFQRGSLNKPLDIEHSPNQGERDYLYGDGDAVNPIVDFAQEGITVWGQRTLQRRPSALDRVNVRRLLLMMRKAIAASTKYLVFEPNDEFTWNEWIGMVEPYLEGLKNSRALYDYRVQMDEGTVTPQAIDQGRMPGRIIIKPTKAAEFITIDFVLVRTGAEIEEYLA